MGTTGLVAVHGIGEQRAGETAQKILEALQRAARDAGLEITCLSETPTGPWRVDVEGCDSTLCVYEVYWADIMDQATTTEAFQTDMLSAAAWYPLLNRKYVPRYRTSIPRRRVLLWSLIAIPLSALISMGYFGLNLLFRMAARLVTPGPGFRLPKRSWLDAKLDRTAGDIFTYVKSAGGRYAPRQRRAMVAARIIDAFERQLHRAAARCDTVYVLSHSLGTLIALHALSGARPVLDYGTDAAAVSYERLRGIVTLGSPLEKIRLAWPMILNESFRGGKPHSGFSWLNIHNPLDPVSSRLTTFDHWTGVRNRRVFGGGVVSAHTLYEGHPIVVESLTEALLGRRLAPRWSPWQRFRALLLSLGETLAILVLFGALVLAGLSLYLGATWLIAHAVGFVIGVIAGASIVSTVRMLTWAVLFLSVVAGYLVFGIGGRNDAEYSAWLHLALDSSLFLPADRELQIQRLRQSPVDNVVSTTAAEAERTVVVARSSADPDTIAFVLLDKSRLHMEDGQPDEAIRVLEEALGLASEEMQPYVIYQIALAKLQASMTDLDAKAKLEELASGRWGRKHVGNASQWLARLAEEEGDWETATRHYAAALDASDPEDSFLVARAGYGLAKCLTHKGDAASAVAALRRAEQAGDPEMAGAVANALEAILADQTTAEDT